MWLPCAPLPCVGISARVAPHRRAGHLLIACADAHQHPLPFELLPPPTLNPSQASQARRRPLSGWTRLTVHPFVASTAGSVAAGAFLARSTTASTFTARSVVPLVGSPSSWLNLSLPWPSRPDPLVPPLFCHGHDHPDRRRRVPCRRPPWLGSLTTGREKKQDGPRGWCCPFCVAPLIVEARVTYLTG